MAQQFNEVVLVHCNIVNNQNQRDPRVLFIFFPNKSFGQLLSISSTNHIYSETFHSEFSHVKVWFADQTYVPLKKEDRISLTFIINDKSI